jgi:hopene-associated glycosyltransferase HpnB
MIVPIVGVFSLLVWVALLCARGGFWRVAERFESQGLRAPPGGWPSVTAITPARNEAAVLKDTFPQLLAQDYPGRLTIAVVDDQSSDGTGLVARRIARGNLRASVLDGARPPNGWTGKLWALEQGLRWADETERPDYLMLVDADIGLKPNVLRGLVSIAEARNAVLVSLMAKLRCESLAEKWLVPAFIFFFRMLYPFAWANDPRRKIAAAAGGCMLVRRQTLLEAGGFAAIGGALIDDCALAALMKRRGPIWLGMTEGALSLRAYPGVGDFGRMVMRSAFAELRFSAVRLALTIGAMTLVFIAPPLIALFSRGLTQACGAISWAIMAFVFAPTLRFYGLTVLRAFALPLIAAVYMLFTIGSAALYWAGRGGEWKGRIQAPTPKGQRA